MEQPVQKPRGREHNVLNKAIRKKEWLELVGRQGVGEGDVQRGTREPDHAGP